MTEEWRPIVGYEGNYEVSNTGKVRSLDRTITQTDQRGTYERRYPGRMLSAKSDPLGYPMVSLTKDGKPKSVRCHTLVLEAFVGPCPDGMECRHLNGIPSDNRLKNLVWGTPDENQMDKIRHGTTNRGTRAHGSILHEMDVLEIRRRVAAGERRQEVADWFGVALRTVSAIVTRQTWGWLKDE